MSAFKRMFSRSVAGDREVMSLTPNSDDVGLVSAIVSGDATAEAELIDRFQAGVFHIVLSVVRNPTLAEDFSQDVFITIIKKIRNGDLHHPHKLKSFVASVARFHAIEQIRVIRRRDYSDIEEAEQVRDPSPNQLEELQASEEFEEIRAVLDELIPRYRELLLRFYVNDEPKAKICADLNLTSAQFDGVLHRARNRYRELYLKGKRAEDRRERR
jgi:RNA polymerase sigma-70 factor, ECF subfamily